MFYRESGQFSTSYRSDYRIFRLYQERWMFLLGLMFAFLVVPFIGNDYWFSAILIPYLVLSLAGLGLNLLTGYAGQLSLGSAAFMAIGAFATYNFHLRIEGLPFFILFFAWRFYRSVGWRFFRLAQFKDQRFLFTGFYVSGAVFCAMGINQLFLVFQQQLIRRYQRSTLTGFWL